MNFYCTNIDNSVTESDLKGLFSQFGQVSRIALLTDYKGRGSGIAFIRMPSSRCGMTAQAGLDGQEVVGRAIRVTEARGTISADLYVYGLPYQATREALEELLAQFEIQAQDIRLVYDSAGMSRGIASESRPGSHAKGCGAVFVWHYDARPGRTPAAAVLSMTRPAPSTRSGRLSSEASAPTSDDFFRTG